MFVVRALSLIILISAGFPASFKGMIHGISTATSFTQAVRDGILAAGDNCSRNTFIGACVAAKYVYMGDSTPFY